MSTSSSSNSIPNHYLMPRKKPLEPIRRHYSQDLKQRVIYLAFTLGKKSVEIAVDLNMPLRVVQRVKRTWFEIGAVCRDRSSIWRQPLLSPMQTNVSTWLIQSSPIGEYLIFRVTMEKHNTEIFIPINARYFSASIPYEIIAYHCDSSE